VTKSPGHKSAGCNATRVFEEGQVRLGAGGKNLLRVIGLPGDGPESFDRLEPKLQEVLARPSLLAASKDALSWWRTWKTSHETEWEASWETPRQPDQSLEPQVLEITPPIEGFLDDLEQALDAVGWESENTHIQLETRALQSGQEVIPVREPVVLASGDPGYFGILRALRRRFEPNELLVTPAASSVSRAFALLGMPWEDAAVISAHGRPLEEVMVALRDVLASQLYVGSRRRLPHGLAPASDPIHQGNPSPGTNPALGARTPVLSGESLGLVKVAVLCEPRVPPRAIAAKLLEEPLANASWYSSVLANLGSEQQSVFEGILEEVASQDHPHRCVLVICGQPETTSTSQLEQARPLVLTKPDISPKLHASTKPSPGSARLQPGWGLPDEAFEHRGEMITKSSIRAVVLARLALGQGGVLWDVGTGCGSVAIEAFLADRSLEVYAIEKDPEQASRAKRNAQRLGARIEIVIAPLETCLGELPPPDRVFVGGGGLWALEAGASACVDGGRVVATFASLERAARAGDLLGNLEQISSSRGSRLADGSWRLQGLNPVFVCWGDKMGALGDKIAFGRGTASGREISPSGASSGSFA